MSAVCKLLLLLTVFLIPLLGATGNFGFEQSKILFFILSISLIGFLWIRKGVRWTGISKAAGLFTLILLITSLTGIDPKNSLIGQEPYFQGWVVYAYLFLFSLLVSSVAIKLEHVAMVLTGSATIVSLVAIQSWVSLNIFNIPVPTYAGRVVSTFGQPNFYAGFLLLTLPFSYLISQGQSLSTQGVTLNNRKLNYFGLISGLISVTGIFVSYSRITILMALMLLILGLIDQLKIKFKVGLVVFGIVSLSVLLALRFSSGIVGDEVSKPILTKNPDLTKESVEKRAYIWPVAWQVVGQRPFLGYGLENIGVAFSDYFK
ncbi:MAG: O-antigen ligase family protein, partial [Candidatus Daviesbacteria bacterium]|nr:O-antigen ligase family protein [Candidatus Daviesbacteria bacterium]